MHLTGILILHGSYIESLFFNANINFFRNIVKSPVNDSLNTFISLSGISWVVHVDCFTNYEQR